MLVAGTCFQLNIVPLGVKIREEYCINIIFENILEKSYDKIRVRHITRDLLKNGWTNIFMKDGLVAGDTLLFEILHHYIFIYGEHSENCVLSIFINSWQEPIERINNIFTELKSKKYKV